MIMRRFCQVKSPGIPGRNHLVISCVVSVLPDEPNRWGLGSNFGQSIRKPCRDLVYYYLSNYRELVTIPYKRSVFALSFSKRSRHFTFMHNPVWKLASTKKSNFCARNKINWTNIGFFQLQ